MTLRRFMIVAVCSFSICLGITKLVRYTRANGPLDRDVAAPELRERLGKISPIIRSLHPNFPYSVIPGGAYTGAELRSAYMRDPVVRDHYAGFNLAAARIVVLGVDHFQYVSFRKDNMVSWTQKKLRIPKGELLLTDGRNYARARCGNRLSSLFPPESTAAAPLAELSLPPVTLETLPKFELPNAEVENLPELPVDLPQIESFLPVRFPEEWRDLTPLAVKVESEQGATPQSGPTLVAGGFPPLYPVTRPFPISPNVPEPKPAFLLFAGLLLVVAGVVNKKSVYRRWKST